mgnify:CR=1 FL=1
MKELFLNRRFFMFLWGGVFALLLTFVFPRVYPWVIWALGCGGGLVVVEWIRKGMRCTTYRRG